MKKPLLSMAVAAVAFSASAAIDFPLDFSKDFGEADGDLTGWNIKATEGDAAGPFAGVFAGSSVCYYVNENQTILLTNSQFADGRESDTWIITPEFEITDPTVMLAFTEACASEAGVRQKYNVYYSTTGNTPEDFLANPPLYTGNASGRDAEMIRTNVRRVVINDFKDKKVRLAFVNQGNTAGVLGFADITVSPWYFHLDREDSYSSFLVDELTPTLSLRVNVSTPVTVQGYKCVLRTQSGFESMIENTQQRFNTNRVALNLTFPDNIRISGSEEPYTITFTPNLEGCTPAVISGTLIHGTRAFDPVIVGEEHTGIWCGWCTGGIAMFNYWKDKYNGKDGNPLFLGIALHGDDALSIPSDINNGYETGYMRQAKRYGLVSDYPSMQLNRVDGGNPVALKLDDFFKVKSFAKVDNVAVAHNPESGYVKAEFDVTTSFSSQNPSLAVAAVLIENDVNSESDEYSQANYYARYSESDFAAQFAADVLPYFKDFFKPNPEHLPAATMHFQDVARLVTPSYSGRPFEQPVTAMQPTRLSLDFTMPSTVAKPENTAVILMVMKQNSGEILGAAELKASEFSVSGVDGVAEDASLSLSFEGNILTVASDTEGAVAVYAADGTLLHSANVAPGKSSLSVEGNGLVVVRATNASGAKTLKHILK